MRSTFAARFSTRVMHVFAGICATIFALDGCTATASAIDLPRAGSHCGEMPQTERWLDAGTPDVGVTPPLLSAHRGGTTLAPENTLWAYRHAFAYGVDFVEIDVRETLDGVFVSMHDATVDRTTDGTGAVAQLTWAQIEALNAADYAPWKGTQYDPTRVPRLEEILELARDANTGIEFDIKDLRNPTRFVDLVASYGLLSRSYFALSGDDAGVAQAYNPEIRAIFNVDGDESPEYLYEQTSRSAVFGSQLKRWPPEKIAAIHDGCSFVLPHSYDLGVLAEADQFRQARQRGADGAQIDAPEWIAEVAERQVPAHLRFLADTRHVCLYNSNNDLGIPRRLLVVLSRLQLPSVRTTNRYGCITLPSDPGAYTVIHFGTLGVRDTTLRFFAPAG